MKRIDVIGKLGAGWGVAFTAALALASSGCNGNKQAGIRYGSGYNSLNNNSSLYGQNYVRNVPPALPTVDPYRNARNERTAQREPSEDEKARQEKAADKAKERQIKADARREAREDMKGEMKEDLLDQIAKLEAKGVLANDPELLALKAKLKKMQKESETKVLTADDRGKAAWEIQCEAANIILDGPDKDGDGIADACEDELQSKFPALNSAVYNGYNVSAVVFDNADLEDWLDKNGGDIGLLDKLFNPQPNFNLRLAEVIKQHEKASDSSLKIVESLYSMDKNKVLADENLTPEVITAGLEKKIKATDYAWIKGGYEEPVIFDPTVGGIGDFSLAQLTGVGSNLPTLHKGDKFMYVVQSYISVPRKGRKIRLAKLADGITGVDKPRMAGAFFVFQRGNLELASVGLGDKVTKGDGMLRSSNGCPVKLTIALLVEQNTANAREMIRENVLIDMENEGKAWEMLPQEISAVRPSGNCTDETALFGSKHIPDEWNKKEGAGTEGDKSKEGGEVKQPSSEAEPEKKELKKEAPMSSRQVEHQTDYENHASMMPEPSQEEVARIQSQANSGVAHQDAERVPVAGNQDADERAAMDAEIDHIERQEELAAQRAVNRTASVQSGSRKAAELKRLEEEGLSPTDDETSDGGVSTSCAHEEMSGDISSEDSRPSDASCIRY